MSTPPHPSPELIVTPPSPARLMSITLLRNEEEGEGEKLAEGERKAEGGPSSTTADGVGESGGEGREWSHGLMEWYEEPGECGVACW